MRILMLDCIGQAKGCIDHIDRVKEFQKASTSCVGRHQPPQGFLKVMCPTPFSEKSQWSRIVGYNAEGAVIDSLIFLFMSSIMKTTVLRTLQTQRKPLLRPSHLPRLSPVTCSCTVITRRTVQMASMKSANRLMALEEGKAPSMGCWQMIPGSNVSRVCVT